PRSGRSSARRSVVKRAPAGIGQTRPWMTTRWNPRTARRSGGRPGDTSTPWPRSTRPRPRKRSPNRPRPGWQPLCRIIRAPIVPLTSWTSARRCHRKPSLAKTTRFGGVRRTTKSTKLS
ncbi:ERV2, partial [Symbiodinium microadriaticum]